MKACAMHSWLRRLFFIAGLLFVVRPAAAEMVARLYQVMQPYYIAMTDERIYIAEDSSRVHLYRRGPEGIAFEKTFGRKGPNTGELDFIHHIRPLNDHMEIPTFGKFARFTLDGRFLDEFKLPVRVFKDEIYRIGGNYLVRDFQFDNEESSVTIRLYSRDFRLVGEIGSKKLPGGKGKIHLVPQHQYLAMVSGDKIYIVDSGRGTRVVIFDRDGNRENSVRLPLKPGKTTAALKEEIITPLREDPEVRPAWREFSKRFHFPDYAPGLDYFDVVDGKFVTRTYTFRDDKVEFVIFDPQGKELKRIFLPYTGRLSRGVRFSFFQGKYYYLKKKASDETWELHCETVWNSRSS